MIINKIQNNQISYKSQSSSKEKIRDNWAYFTGLITLPLGGYLGRKDCKDKFEKEHKLLLSEKAQETIKSMNLIPENEVCLKKQNTLLEKLKELEPERKRIIEELNDMNIPESKLRYDLQTSCSDKIIRHKEGRPTEMPNCIMFIGESSDFGLTLYDWLCTQSQSQHTIIEGNAVENLTKYMEKNQKPIDGEWNLVFVKNLDQYINTQKATSKEIAAMKDLMSNCAEDSATTIIFQTKTPSLLNSTATQLHRVNKRLSINNIDERKFFEYERLKEKEKEIFEKMKPYEKRLKEISEQIQKVQDIDAKIKKLENNKNFKKGIAFGVITGAVVSGCMILINKFMTKERNEKNVNAN